MSNEQLHILIGYNPKRGIADHFRSFSKNFKNQAKIYFYPKENTDFYPSNGYDLITKHIKGNTELENRLIFYLPVDLILEASVGLNFEPSFQKGLKQGIYIIKGQKNPVHNEQYFLWFKTVLNLQKYNLKYSFFCKLLNHNFLIQKSNWVFWSNVEKTTKRFYQIYIKKYNSDLQNLNYTEFRSKIAFAKESMRYIEQLAFAINIGKFDVKIRTNKAEILNYYLEDRNERAEDLFLNSSPFYSREILKEPLSPLSKLVCEYKAKLDADRFDLKDVTFLIPVRIDSDSRLVNLYSVVNYLHKYFKTNIIVFESDHDSKIDIKELPNSCLYYFNIDFSPYFHRTRIINWMIKKSTSRFISIYDCDVIIPTDQLKKSVSLLRKNLYDMIFPYDGNFVDVDPLFKRMFSEILDPNLFNSNKNKFRSFTKRSNGGAVLLTRASYIKAGMENENFSSWGPEDLERLKRMRNLGYKITRIEGSLYHLIHERNENSKYYGNKKIEFMEEYFKICNLSINELLNYITSWEWNQND
ncbi:galactosyltransferase-related protein [Dyadobacter sp. 32]|uniref:galactosyltransferase-related protein n=1 Tax=Dyadobacter sp. 32 TaxID=538966 RepID=UPI0039C6FC7D